MNEERMNQSDNELHLEHQYPDPSDNDIYMEQLRMESTEELRNRLDALQNIVQRCYAQIDILSDKVLQLEKSTQNHTSSRNCNINHAFKRIKFCRKTRRYDFETSSSDRSFNTPKTDTKGLPYSNEVYQDVLQENHTDLISTIDLTNTTVLDQLVSDDVVSMSDAETIRYQCKTRKEQTRELLLKLATYGVDKFRKFCSSINPEYHFLAELLEKSFSKKLNDKDINGNNEITRSCIYCKLKRHVAISDVIDDLYANKITDTKTTTSILKEKNVDIAWNEIRHHVNGSGYRLDVLCKALTPKYEHIKKELIETGIDELKCFCRSIETKDNGYMPSTNVPLDQWSNKQSSFSSSFHTNDSFDQRSVDQSSFSSRCLDTTIESSGINDTQGTQRDPSEHMESLEEAQNTSSGKRKLAGNVDSNPCVSVQHWLDTAITSTAQNERTPSYMNKKYFSLPSAFRLRAGFVTRSSQSPLGDVWSVRARQASQESSFGEEMNDNIRDVQGVQSELNSLSLKIECISESVNDRGSDVTNDFGISGASENVTNMPVRKRTLFSRKAFKRPKTNSKVLTI